MGGMYRVHRVWKMLLVVPALMWGPLAIAEIVRIGISTEDAQGPIGSSWQAVADYLGQALPDAQFILEPIRPSEFPSMLKKQAVDAAIADPAVLIVAGAKSTLLATPRFQFKNQEFSGGAGALVVRTARADLRTWADVRNVEVATADAHSLRDWLAVCRELQNVRWTGRLRVVSSRGAALEDVAAGRAEAAALPAGTLEALQATGAVSESFYVIKPPVGSRVRVANWPVAVSTPVYSGLAFAALDRLSPELQRRIAAALLAMPPVPTSHADAITLSGWDVYGSDADVHAVLRDLGVPPYWKIRELTLADVVRRFTYVFFLAGALLVIGLGVIITLSATNRALRAEVARRSEAEKALLRSIERFESIAAFSSDWIWECDEKGDYTYSNPTVRAMLGYEPEEIFGRHHLDFVATLERERLAAEGRSLLDGKRRIFREVYRLRTKDGRLVVHEITAEPVRSNDGKLIGYRGVNRDITDRARAVRLTT